MRQGDFISRFNPSSSLEVDAWSASGSKAAPWLGLRSAQMLPVSAVSWGWRSVVLPSYLYLQACWVHSKLLFYPGTPCSLYPVVLGKWIIDTVVQERFSIRRSRKTWLWSWENGQEDREKNQEHRDVMSGRETVGMRWGWLLVLADAARRWKLQIDRWIWCDWLVTSPSNSGGMIGKDSQEDLVNSIDSEVDSLKETWW